MPPAGLNVNRLQPTIRLAIGVQSSSSRRIIAIVNVGAGDKARFLGKRRMELRMELGRHYATSRKVACSILVDVIGFFHLT
jgi:hypothetical protein